MGAESALPVRIRCNCGALFEDGVRYCPECGEPRTYVRRELEQLTAATGGSIDELREKDRAGVLTASLPGEVRASRLQRAIAAMSGRGYEIVSQTESGAQMKQRKQFSWLLAIVFLIFTAGIGLLIYLVYLLVASGKLVYLAVDERGTVAASGSDDPEIRALLKELNEAV